MNITGGFLMSLTVAVTGAQGYVGSQVCGTLVARGNVDRVIGLDMATTGQ
jgi:nucleoside-diphosphate-sugar epimerase